MGSKIPVVSPDKQGGRLVGLIRNSHRVGWKEGGVIFVSFVETQIRSRLPGFPRRKYTSVRLRFTI